MKQYEQLQQLLQDLRYVVQSGGSMQDGGAEGNQSFFGVMEKIVSLIFHLIVNFVILCIFFAIMYILYVVIFKTYPKLVADLLTFSLFKKADLNGMLTEYNFLIDHFEYTLLPKHSFANDPQQIFNSIYFTNQNLVKKCENVYNGIEKYYNPQNDKSDQQKFMQAFSEFFIFYDFTLYDNAAYLNYDIVYPAIPTQLKKYQEYISTNLNYIFAAPEEETPLKKKLIFPIPSKVIDNGNIRYALLDNSPVRINVFPHQVLQPDAPIPLCKKPGFVTAFIDDQQKPINPYMECPAPQIAIPNYEFYEKLTAYLELTGQVVIPEINMNSDKNGTAGKTMPIKTYGETSKSSRKMSSSEKIARIFFLDDNNYSKLKEFLQNDIVMLQAEKEREYSEYAFYAAAHNKIPKIQKGLPKAIRYKKKYKKHYDVYMSMEAQIRSLMAQKTQVETEAYSYVPLDIYSKMPQRTNHVERIKTMKRLMSEMCTDLKTSYDLMEFLDVMVYLVIPDEKDTDIQNFAQDYIYMSDKFSKIYNNNNPSTRFETVNEFSWYMFEVIDYHKNKTSYKALKDQLENMMIPNPSLKQDPKKFYYDLKYFISNFMNIPYKERMKSYNTLLRSFPHLQMHIKRHQKQLLEFILKHPVFVRVYINMEDKYGDSFMKADPYKVYFETDGLYTALQSFYDSKKNTKQKAFESQYTITIKTTKRPSDIPSDKLSKATKSANWSFTKFLRNEPIYEDTVRILNKKQYDNMRKDILYDYIMHTYYILMTTNTKPILIENRIIKSSIPSQAKTVTTIDLFDSTHGKAIAQTYIDNLINLQDYTNVVQVLHLHFNVYQQQMSSLYQEHYFNNEMYFKALWTPYKREIIDYRIKEYFKRSFSGGNISKSYQRFIYFWQYIGDGIGMLKEQLKQIYKRMPTAPPDPPVETM